MKKLKANELNRKSTEEYKKSPKLPIAVILDNIRSMHNVGSIFRTSDAFLVEEIILCGITATPPNREITKTALGSTESVSWKYEKCISETIKQYKQKGYQILGVEQTDSSLELEQFKPQKGNRYVLVLGNEITGISEEAIELVDNCLVIPQYGTKHSLNVSVAAGIVIQYFCKEMIEPGY